MKKNLFSIIISVTLIFALVSCATVREEVTPIYDPPSLEEIEIVSSIKDIQKYGNIVLTTEKSALDEIGAEYGDVFTLTINGNTLSVPYCTSYSDVDLGSLVLRNDGETLIFAINMGDAATTYGIAEKKTNPDKSYEWIYSEGIDKNSFTFTLLLTGKGEYRDEFLIHQLTRTNERADYSSDAVFANFREIKGGELGEGALFRSSSPVNNEIGRAAFADAFVKENGIKCVMNLADNDEAIKGYIADDGFASPYYASLFESGNVIALNMGVSFKAREFQASLAEGMRFLSSHEGPYLVHCNEGKDRAGFTSAILGAFMGLSYEELVEDYMTTYENYYHVQKGSEQYEAVKRSNIDSMLSFIAGVEIDALNSVDLKAKAEEFMAVIGLSGDEISALRENLKKSYR